MWDNDAEKRFELLPVPPMMKSYARLQAEKIARGRGLARVTDACVRETEQVYRDFIGEEKTEQLRAYVTGEGPEPQLMDELFFDDEQALYHIDVCYTKYGENSELVRNELVAMMRRLRALMKEEGLTEIMAGLAMQNGHLVACLQQAGHQLTPDKERASDNESVHRLRGTGSA